MMIFFIVGKLNGPLNKTGPLNGLRKPTKAALEQKNALMAWAEVTVK